MTIPKALLQIVRRKTYTEAKVGHRRGGKYFPPTNSLIFGVYKRLSDAYKRKRNRELFYIARAILDFARSRSFTKLSSLASFERRFGDMALGFSLQAAISELGVGAMRKLNFEKELIPTIVPKTLASSN